uniref:Uncharacterized protein n=1 Tax=Acrobeloides nanus TaxID=290746 RepID=A0A914DP66_9BILA
MTKSKKVTEVKPSQPSTSVEIDSAISLNKTGQIVLKIHAKPGAKKSIVTDIGTQEIGIAIAAPPREGQANEELVETIARILGLKKSEISLDKGTKSRSKILMVESKKLSIDQVRERLINSMD